MDIQRMLLSAAPLQDTHRAQKHTMLSSYRFHKLR